MLDTLLLKQLNDPDPSVRRKAVVALGKSQNEDALPYLATVYKKDRDPEIRQLAKKAGVYIKRETADIFGAAPVAMSAGAAKAADDDELMSSASTYYEELDLPVAEPIVEVSEGNQERAKGLLQQALDANLRGNNDKAIHYFQNALKRNPNLKTDNYALSMASTITGITSGERAIQTLMEDSKKKKRGGGSGSGQPEEGATWSNAFIDLLIYGLINAAVVGVAMYLFFALILPPLSESLAQQIALSSQGMSTMQSNQLAAAFGGISPTEIMLNFMNNFSTPFTLIYSGIYGVGSITALVIFYLFIHLVSTTILGGEGGFRRLITKATLPQAFLTPVLAVSSVGAAFLPLLNPDLGSLTTLISFGLSGLFYAVVSSRIGVTYRFGAGRGCSAILLASIAIGLAGCMLIFILTSIAGSGLQSMVTR